MREGKIYSESPEHRPPVVVPVYVTAAAAGERADGSESRETTVSDTRQNVQKQQ